MSTIILSCTSLVDYVNAAQEAMHTQYDVVTIDRQYHDNPPDMKQQIIDIINELPPGVDTVLVAMGFCGGAWDHMTFPRRVVIPKVDDCISLLLHTDDEYHPNLKEFGHLYMIEKDPAEFSVEKMIASVERYKEYKGWDRDSLFHLIFDNYHYMDIVDTGLNEECYTEEYVIEAQKNADLLNATLDYVTGSNLLLEKLVSGRWDQQFIVAEPGELIKHKSFFHA